MSAHWYAVTTKPQKEKKVTGLLSKWGVEHFTPALSQPVLKFSSRDQSGQAFCSCIFVWAEEKFLQKLKNIPWVVNFLYWKSKPAVFPAAEIELLKKITQSFSLIRLEKTTVNAGAPIRYLDEPSVIYNDNSVHVQYKQLRVSLPTLGYILTAERLKPTGAVIQKQTGLLAGFPKKLNAFFFT
jgi:transcription antitermination factor NusG